MRQLGANNVISRLYEKGHTQTAYGTLERGRYVYDVITTLDAVPNTIQRIQQGVATVSPSVTRADS